MCVYLQINGILLINTSENTVSKQNRGTKYDLRKVL